eukprot:Blabericola_migrator_1__13@NODE_1004_length_5726_cov_209_116982_g158_i3_p2_GENE_NODE_1004_length_5726_cov_209_116982_g158_i3NODE_1004_length_5726_cov_209_116982_g158_i3_p2_ORF_typecomplete_len557_score99_13Aminotran_1_2/PF00155_21/6_3e69DegT_DnrJ_EryC1/PF01041_17/1_1e06OKR_DC_1/PF01276_20/0_08_NODE_1004_length_5726_cov_209_116982_g158_i339245594
MCPHDHANVTLAVFKWPLLAKEVSFCDPKRKKEIRVLKPIMSMTPTTPVANPTTTASHEATPSSQSTVSSFDSGVKLVKRNTPALSLDAYPERIIRLEYAVRGAVAIRADQIATSISDDLPYSKVLQCNIGNPQALGLRPLTYIRETISLSSCPSLLEKSDDQLATMFARDNIARSRRYVAALRSMGAYTHSQGNPLLREECANFFERRDGVRPNPNRILLTNGASEAINTLLTASVGGPKDGVLLPMPQYPLYAASMTRLNGTPVFYELDEEDNWGLDESVLKRQYHKAIEDGIDVKILVVINPGNPVPTFLSRDQIRRVLEFAQEHHLLVIADEVYQENIYKPEQRQFVSFRRVLIEERFRTQLASIHSCSKGFYGECGMRGGVCVLDNVDDESFTIIYKLRSVDLCSNTIGQVCMTTILNPPRPGDESYDLYIKEKTETLDEMKQKAEIIGDFMNTLTGVTCVRIDAGMYVFPKINMPVKALEAAAAENIAPDLMYSLQLLEATGIATTPGSGFGQKEGTHHIRMTILPALEDLQEALDLYRDFHENFMKKYL